MIKTIIFDCSDTLLHFGGIDYLTTLVGDRTYAEAMHYTLFRSPAWHKYDNGQIEEAELPDALLPLLKESDRAIGAQYLREWVNTYSVIEGIPELLADVRRAGYKMYLLSDFPACFHVLWERFPLLHQFDGRVVSYEVGFSKKDEKIFDILLEKYDLDPEDCVFIDDIPRNVEIGEAHGIRGIRFTSVEQLRSDLNL